MAAPEPRSVVAVTGLNVEARIAEGAGVRTIAGGGDAQRLAAALEREFTRGAAAIISFGIAGGLAATAMPGTWLVADAVIARASRWPVDAAWAAALAYRLPGAVRGDLAASDAIISDTDDKHALGKATGALAVDTESHVVAAFAIAHGIPFAVFRVIADPATRALAPAASYGMRSDGTIDQRAVLGAVARSPGQLPLLMRNAIDVRTALRALSRGRRLLGPGLGYPDL
ncbi:MAG TPA: phosphorylase [Casimicrobiaceae bacterium]